MRPTRGKNVEKHRTGSLTSRAGGKYARPNNCSPVEYVQSRCERAGITRFRHTGSPGCYRSEEHTSELQSLRHLVCRLLLEKKKIVIMNEVQNLRRWLFTTPQSSVILS